MKVSRIEHQFVEFLPDDVDEGVLYVSMTYAIAEHRCCCGCGERVVTPLSPNDWVLTFDGRVSLRPSIGNWSFPCQSHYWIREGEVVWAPRWTREQVETGRAQDRRQKDAYYSDKDDTSDVQPKEPPIVLKRRKRLLEWLRSWFG